MPTLGEVIATLGTPAGLIGVLIVGVAINIVTRLLSLIFGKSTNTIFIFIKKRSTKQIAKRQKRVELMRREEKVFNYYLSFVNTQLLLALVYLVTGGMGIVIAFIVQGSSGYGSMLMLVTGVLAAMTSVSLVFEGIAIRQDVAEALEDAAGDNDKAPL